MFPWWNVARPTGAPRKRAEMYRHEVEERAALLFRLGYSKKHALQRLTANVAWDFELHRRPAHAGEIAKIVDQVYRRGGIASGPPSV